jgi:hypothetical protein
VTPEPFGAWECQELARFAARSHACYAGPPCVRSAGSARSSSASACSSVRRPSRVDGAGARARPAGKSTHSRHPTARSARACTTATSAAGFRSGARRRLATWMAAADG